MAMSCVLSLIDLRQTPDVSGTISDVAELCGPCGDLLERLGIEPVIAMAALTSRDDQTTAPQDRQML
jgi:hypothetical protein